MLVLTFLLFLSVVQCGYEVNYLSTWVCGLKGGSVVLPCKYKYSWIGSWGDGEWYTDHKGRFRGHSDSKYPYCSLRIDKLSDDHAGVYHFRFYTTLSGWMTGKSGIRLSVTDLQVKVDPAVVTEGQSVTLTCGTTCALSNNPTYIWYKNGQLVAYKHTARDNKLHLNPISSEDAGSYSCAVRGYGNPPSSAVSINVRYAPKDMSVSVFPSGRIAEGSSVILTCSSDANPPVHSYTWYVKTGDTGLRVGTGQNVSFANISSEQSGQYYCKAENDVGVRSTDLTHLNVTYSPKNASVSASLSGEVPEGSSVTLTCSSDANPPVYNYTWYMKTGAESVVMGTGESISFNVTSDTSGLYYCEAQNELGSQTSAGVSVSSKGEGGNSNMLLIAEVIAVVALTIILTMLGIVWLRIRQKRRQSHAGTSSKQENTESDTSTVYDNISAVAMDVKAAQAVDAGYEDDVHYASISGLGGRDDPVYSNIRRPKPRKQRENVEYSTVKFSQPSAATQNQSEGITTIYSTVNKSSNT